MRYATPSRDFAILEIVALILWFVAGATPAFAPPVGFGFTVRPIEVELSAPHVDAVSGPMAARLDQARALAAARNWDEAADIYREVPSDRSGRLVAVGERRYVTPRTYCNRQISAWPAEGLAAYRKRVDAVAESTYRDAVAIRDVSQLRRVVDEWFCSSWGDDALLALGDLALERADYSQARGYWEQISPQLRTPDGLPIWLALRGVDLKAKWPEVEHRLANRDMPADWLAFPDTTIDLAAVRARLVLVSIREGDFDRASLELEILRRLHPTAEGAFGGQQAVYVSALTRLLSAAKPSPARSMSRDWPTFAGSQNRSMVASPMDRDFAPLWKEPIRISPPPAIRVSMVVGGAGIGAIALAPDASTAPEDSASATQLVPSCSPAIVDNVVYFADGRAIRAANLLTGDPAITKNGILYQYGTNEPKAGPPAINVSGELISGQPRLTLNIVDSILFGRTSPGSAGPSQPGQAQGRSAIIGLDLKREGLLTFRSPSAPEGWIYDGVPVSDGERIFIAMRQTDVTPHSYVVCFDIATGQQRWKTSIAAADSPSGGNECTHNLLTLVENRIYSNTNLGVVAAIDAEDGEIRWLAQYVRAGGKISNLNAGQKTFLNRDPSPCIYANGLVIAAPSDTPSIFALDAETGKRVWETSQIPDTVHLLAVAGKRLIVSGDRLASIDLTSGHIQWVWPESPAAGIRGMGRGIVAGQEIFWPTRDRILVIDAASGAQSRSPIVLEPIAGGANLAASQGRLVVVGYDRLMVLGPRGGQNPDAQPREASN